MAVMAVSAWPPSMVTVLISACTPAPPPESDPAMIRMRAVEVIARTFVPELGAKFSMCTAMSCARQMPRNSSRGGLDRRADVIDEPLNLLLVLAFGHHPDQWLGTGLADDQPALAFPFRLGGGDALADAVRLQRLGTAVEANVLQELGHRLELAKQFARRP